MKMPASNDNPPGQYNFDLSADQEARARKLHRESIVVDLLSQHAGGNIFAHYREIRQAKKDGVVAFYAHCQPVYGTPRDLKAFDVAHAKGLRSFMLTYNRMDNVGVGCTERVDAGLSMYGIDVVKHCNEIGMIVDV